MVNLFGAWRLSTAGISRLLLAHHVNYLDPTEDHTGSAIVWITSIGCTRYLMSRWSCSMRMFR